MNTMNHLNRIRRTALAAAIGAVCFSGATFAADEPHRALIKAREQLLNAEIKNRQGEALGEIEDLVLDAQGQIKYVVISHGGFLDIGDKVVAVPWDPSRISIGENEYVVMDVTRAQLAEAPSFEKDKWPDMTTQAWSDRERTFSDRYAARHDAQGPDTKVSFEALDTNRDGHVSKQEAQAEQQLSARFAKLDRNNDGSLSQWEFNAYEQPTGMAGIEPATESPSAQARASLSPEEQKRKQEIAQSSEQQNVTKDAKSDSLSAKGGGNTGKSAGQTARDPTPEPSPMAKQQSGQKIQFGKLDADANGQLDRKEAKASETLDAKFSQVDRNNDGHIDRAEFSAFESGELDSAKEGAQKSGAQQDQAQQKDKSAR